ncbi:MAG: PEP-CTERM sorting domain-containing protein, partial [Burkholderiales bacterium]
VSGMTCSAGELSWVTGPAFSAMCSGDLRIDSSVVLAADESITLLAAGYLWQAGTLIAPKIVLTAGANLIFTGGLFSGSPDYFPDVQALGFAGSPAAVLSVFSDLVPRPVIDPVYGAVEMRIGSGVEMGRAEVLYDKPVAGGVVLLAFIPFPDFTLEETASPVPEPSRLVLFAAGLGLVAWKRRVAGRLSRTAHTTSNPEVTLEN